MSIAAQQLVNTVVPAHGAVLVHHQQYHFHHRSLAAAGVDPPPPGTQLSVRLRGSSSWMFSEPRTASLRATDAIGLGSYALVAIGLASGLMMDVFSITLNHLRIDDRRGWTLSQVRQQQRVPAGKAANPGQLPDLDVTKVPRDNDKTWGRPSVRTPGDDDDWSFEAAARNLDDDDDPPYHTRKQTYQSFQFVAEELPSISCRFITEMISCGPHYTRTYDVGRAKRKELIHEGFDFPTTGSYDERKCSRGVPIAFLEAEVTFGEKSAYLCTAGKFHGAQPKQNCPLSTVVMLI